MSLTHVICAAVKGIKRGFANSFTSLSFQTDRSAYQTMGINCTLYEDKDFKGTSFYIYGQEGDLGTLGMKNKVSSIVVHSGVWLFYENVGFKGKGLYLKPGSYPDLQQMGMNDRFSSCRGLSEGGNQIYLFADKEFSGRILNLSKSAPDFFKDGFNDITSSIIVLGGNWTVYKDVNYQKPLGTYGPGFYTSLDWGGADNNLSSVKLVA